MNLVTFVINLETSRGRMEESSRQLQADDVTFTRVNAVDGRHISADQFSEFEKKTSMRFLGRQMKGTEVGCFLSHRRAITKFVETGASFGLILEDDFKLKPDTFPVIEQIVQDLDRSCAPNFDCINLARQPRNHFCVEATYGTEHGSVRLARSYFFPVIATALLWSREGAERFLDRASSPIGPVDHVYRSHFCKSGTGMATIPPLFSTTNFPSDINHFSLSSVPKPKLGRRHWCEAVRQVRNYSNVFRNRAGI